MIDLDMLQLQSVKTGLGVKYLSKEERISILLKQLNELFADDEIILKGGTAFNRGYLHSTQKGRFSEDLDIDYCKHISLNYKIKYIKKIMKKISDFDVLSPRILHRTLRFDCQYTNQLNEKDRVQVEFYLSEKKSTGSFQKILLQSQYLPVSATLFPVYKLEDLLAQKLISLYRREEGRDIYDIFYGLDLPFNKTLVHTALSNLFIHYHLNLKHQDFFKKLAKKIDGMQANSKYIGNSTNHFIPHDLRPDWSIFIMGLKDKIVQTFE